MAGEIDISAVEVLIPGPPGLGVTPSQLADLVLATGDTMTGGLTISLDGSALTIETAGGTDRLNLHTTSTGNGLLSLLNSLILRGYSDNAISQTFQLILASGNLTTLGEISAASYVGDTLWLEIEIDGGGVALTTGTKRRIKIPYDCQIVSNGTAAWEVALDQIGSIGLDLWMESYALYPPTSADRISGTLGSQNPRVVSAIKNQSASLTGWTIDLVKGEYLFVGVDSITTATFATLSLHVKRT